MKNNWGSLWVGCSEPKKMALTHKNCNSNFVYIYVCTYCLLSPPSHVNTLKFICKISILEPRHCLHRIALDCSGLFLHLMSSQWIFSRRMFLCFCEWCEGQLLVDWNSAVGKWHGKSVSDLVSYFKFQTLVIEPQFPIYLSAIQVLSKNSLFCKEEPTPHPPLHKFQPRFGKFVQRATNCCHTVVPSSQKQEGSLFLLRIRISLKP